MDSTLSQPTSVAQTQPTSPMEWSVSSKPMKMSPQELQQFRSKNVSFDSIARAMGERDESFKAKLNNPIPGVKDRAGKPMNWNEFAVNMEVYGNPYGDAATQQAPTNGKTGNPYFGGGVFDKTLGAVSGAIQVGVAKGASALGFDRIERGMNNGGSRDVNELPQTAKAASNTLTTVGGIAGSFIAPGVGTGAGAFAGKAVGNLLETVAATRTPQDDFKTPGQLIAEPIKEGAIGAAVDYAFLGTGKVLGKVGGAVVTKARKAFAKSGAVLTNVKDETLERAISNPYVMEKAIKTINENPSQPFLVMSQKIGNHIIEKFNKAGKAIGAAKEAFKASSPDMKFDVSATFDDFEKILKEENMSFMRKPVENALKLVDDAGRPLEGVIVQTGKPTGKIAQGKFEPIPEEELAIISNYIKKVTKGKGSTIDDVLDLKKLYNEAYKKLGENSLGTTSNAQRILRRLREAVDEKVTAAMPEELAAAYKEFSDAASLVDDYGNVFVTENGKGKLVLSDKGEGHLNTLWGMRNGQRREDFKALSDAMGYDIVDNMRYLKDAQSLTDSFPKTGSRTLDIIRGVLQQGSVAAGAGVGYQAGGITGAALGAAAGLGTVVATSPRLVGKGMMAAGKVGKSGAVKGLTKMITRLSPAERAALYSIISSQMQNDESSTKQ